jgi:pimeloyl-ACP methyl ester carboxylesterase
VKKLVLIDPAGAKSIALTPLLKVVRMPFVAEAALGLVGSERIIENAAKDFFDPALVGHFKAQYKVQMQFNGFKRAVLSTIRNGMLDSFAGVYETLGKMNKDVLLIWGRNDQTVPFEHSEVLRNAIPKLEFQIIEDCGHIPHYEKPEAVNPILLAFLRKL